jgi:hypothetical protein
LTLEWLRRLFRRNRLNDDIDDEISFHLAQEAQLRLDRGEVPDRVHAQARRDFGNVLRIKETTRDMWGGNWLDDVARDARYALRGLTRSPALAGVAILSLAFGIGANRVACTTVNIAVLTPMAIAVVRMTVTPNPGFFSRLRRMTRTSWSSDSTIPPSPKVKLSFGRPSSRAGCQRTNSLARFRWRSNSCARDASEPTAWLVFGGSRWKA